VLDIAAASPVVTALLAYLNHCPGSPQADDHRGDGLTVRLCRTSYSARTFNKINVI
jgi:hypothetical protein